MKWPKILHANFDVELAYWPFSSTWAKWTCRQNAEVHPDVCIELRSSLNLLRNCAKIIHITCLNFCADLLPRSLHYLHICNSTITNIIKRSRINIKGNWNNSWKYSWQKKRLNVNGCHVDADNRIENAKPGELKMHFERLTNVEIE